jgi:hypothetical protein
MIPQMQIAPMRVKAVMGASFAYLAAKVKLIRIALLLRIDRRRRTDTGVSAFNPTQ